MARDINCVLASIIPWTLALVAGFVVFLFGHFALETYVVEYFRCHAYVLVGLGYAMWPGYQVLIATDGLLIAVLLRRGCRRFSTPHPVRGPGVPGVWPASLLVRLALDGSVSLVVGAVTTLVLQVLLLSSLVRAYGFDPARDASELICWVPTTIAGLAVAWIIFRGCCVTRAKAWRAHPGTCAACGYDLRGSLAAGRDLCPECGQRYEGSMELPPLADVPVRVSLNAVPPRQTAA